MNTKTTRILLADDHEVVRRGLRALLELHPGWEVCGEAENGRVAVELVQKLAPDIVVMDIGMKQLNGFEATRQILERTRGIEVLVLSIHDNEQTVREVIGAGARGYVLKSDAGRDLVAAVEALLRREPFFSPSVAVSVRAAALRVAGPRRSSLRPAGELTRREREVLQLLAEGRANKAVAKVLGISVKTAETHRARIMRKLGMKSVAELVRYAIRNGFIEA
jgi:DNA-binding NarL/FixJ family response regulator